MQTELVLVPLEGIGELRLNASRAAILATLGTPNASFYKGPTSRHPTEAWYQNGLQVFYQGDQPTVAFIEISRDCGIEPVLFGLRVFATPVPILIAEIQRHAKLDETDAELGFSYTFPFLELAFWKPDDDDAEAPYFSTVGIGVSGYFSS